MRSKKRARERTLWSKRELERERERAKKNGDE